MRTKPMGLAHRYIACLETHGAGRGHLVKEPSWAKTRVVVAHAESLERAKIRRINTELVRLLPLKIVVALRRADPARRGIQAHARTRGGTGVLGMMVRRCKLNRDC